MGKGRPTKKRLEEMHMALEDAYNMLKETNPSYQEIIDKANESELIINSIDGKIGDKTIFQSKSKNICTLYNRIKDDKDDTKKLKTLIPTKFSQTEEQLHSSLRANALLVNQIEVLENRLNNKEQIISQKDMRIMEYQEEIKKLRAQCIDIKR